MSKPIKGKVDKKTVGLLILISLFIIVWSFGVVGIQPECNATIYEFNSSWSGCTVSSDLTLETGTYYMNVTGTNGEGFNFTADSTTLDCNGATIIGNSTISGRLFYVYQNKDITIKNCNVSYYQTGFIHRSATSAIRYNLTNNTLTDVVSGIVVFRELNYIINNTFINCTADCIQADGFAADKSIIDGNNFTLQGQGDAIHLAATGGAGADLWTIRNNYFTGNTTKHAIFFSGSSHNKVYNNTITNGYGLSFESAYLANNITFDGNNFTNIHNGTTYYIPFHFQHVLDNVFTNNFIDNVSRGFFVSNVSGFNITSNTILNAQNQGIRGYNNNSLFNYNTFGGNILSDISVGWLDTLMGSGASTQTTDLFYNIFNDAIPHIEMFAFTPRMNFKAPTSPKSVYFFNASFSSGEANLTIHNANISSYIIYNFSNKSFYPENTLQDNSEVNITLEANMEIYVIDTPTLTEGNNKGMTDSAGNEIEPQVNFSSNSSTEKKIVSSITTSFNLTSKFKVDTCLNKQIAELSYPPETKYLKSISYNSHLGETSYTDGSCTNNQKTITSQIDNSSNSNIITIEYAYTPSYDPAVIFGGGTGGGGMPSEDEEEIPENETIPATVSEVGEKLKEFGEKAGIFDEELPYGITLFGFVVLFIIFTSLIYYVSPKPVKIYIPIVGMIALAFLIGHSLYKPVEFINSVQDKIFESQSITALFDSLSNLGGLIGTPPLFYGILILFFGSFIISYLIKKDYQKGG